MPKNFIELKLKETWRRTDSSSQTSQLGGLAALNKLRLLVRVRREGVRQGQKATHNATQGEQSEKWCSGKTGHQRKMG